VQDAALVRMMDSPRHERDLKPANILLQHPDESGEATICNLQSAIPLVTDFGLAKRLEGGGRLTYSGAIVGTPEYLAPEQALAGKRLTTAADTYSLGVILYELLTGRVPFRGENAWETLRQVVEQEPTPVRALAKEVDRDLETICLKCLAKDPELRYGSAEALARDIERYLHDEPVEACPPGTTYRLRKFARRYKKAMATAAAFMLVLMAATVTSIGLASWALKERSHAEEQKQAADANFKRAEANFTRAEANFKRALDAVDQMLTRVGEVQLLHVPQMEPVRRELLRDALRFYEEFLKERGESLMVRSEAASAYRRVGQIQVLLGQRDEGEAAYRQAVALLEKLTTESPDDPALRNKLACVHHDLGLLYLSTQRWPQAEAALEQAVALLEQVDRQHPTLLKNRHDLAKSHFNMVNLYRQMGRLDRAETAFLKSMTLLDDLLAGDPENVEYSLLLAACHQNVGVVYGAQGRTTDAEAAYQKALALNQELVRDHPEVVDHRKRLAGTYNNLGLLYARERQHAKAEEAYQQSLALNEAILRDHPKVVAFMVDLAGSYSNMATHLRNTRSPEESLEWSARAIRILEPLLEQDPRDVLARACLFDAFQGRGWTLLRLDRPEEAAQDWRRIIELSAGQPHINMRLHRPSPLTRLGEHVQATAEIETLLVEGHVQGRNLYMFAYLHSLCSAAAANDASLSPAEQVNLADQYGGRAVELLRKAEAAGYFQDPGRLAHMKEDKDLNAIRSRPDFQSLLADLEGRQKKE
jgi:tetratricopeptide (TPR) repeat protein